MAPDRRQIHSDSSSLQWKVRRAGESLSSWGPRRLSHGLEIRKVFEYTEPVEEPFDLLGPEQSECGHRVGHV